MAGTALQKNQEGLIHSLLYKILTQRRELITGVFPRQCDVMMTSTFTYLHIAWIGRIIDCSTGYVQIILVPVSSLMQ
jgi:hypothetical protein